MSDHTHADVAAVINRLASFPPEHDWHVKASVAARAKRIVAQTVVPPKVFVEDGGNLCMTWEVSDGKVYLYVGDDAITLQRYPQPCDVVEYADEDDPGLMPDLARRCGWTVP